MSLGTSYIISAPSGTGKTSLVNELIKDFSDIHRSISCTTRKKRSEEKDGVDYYFVSKDEFDNMVLNNEFLEYAKIIGKSYGTSKQAVQKILNEGEDVILEIDWQGARDVKKIIKDAVSVFILPPSKEILRQRMFDRNQNDIEDIEKRLEESGKEVSHYLEYDYLVVNDGFDHALEELKAIVVSRKCQQSFQGKKLESLIVDLMS